MSGSHARFSLVCFQGNSACYPLATIGYGRNYVSIFYSQGHGVGLFFGSDHLSSTNVPLDNIIWFDLDTFMDFAFFGAFTAFLVFISLKLVSGALRRYEEDIAYNYDDPIGRTTRLGADLFADFCKNNKTDRSFISPVCRAYDKEQSGKSKMVLTVLVSLTTQEKQAKKNNQRRAIVNRVLKQLGSILKDDYRQKLQADAKKYVYDISCAESDIIITAKFDVTNQAVRLYVAFLNQTEVAVPHRPRAETEPEIYAGRPVVNHHSSLSDSKDAKGQEDVPSVSGSSASTCSNSSGDKSKKQLNKQDRGQLYQQKIEEYAVVAEQKAQELDIDRGRQVADIWRSWFDRYPATHNLRILKGARKLKLGLASREDAAKTVDTALPMAGAGAASGAGSPDPSVLALTFNKSVGHERRNVGHKSHNVCADLF